MSEPSFPKHPTRAPEAAAATTAGTTPETTPGPITEATPEVTPEAQPEAKIDIVVNGEPRRVAAGITVSGLLAELGLADRRVAVERNREVVPRAEHARTALAAGDALELVTFVGGG
jgi:thiamine biosynthesis protein ThiS